MTRAGRAATLRRDPAWIGALVIGAGIALLAAMSAHAQQRVPDDEVIQTSVARPEDGTREGFRARVRDEMADWRRRMQAFDQKVAAGGQRGLDAAEAGLRAAWNDTEAEAGRVQAATEADWARTRTAWEEASQRMSRAWDKARL